jgi:hypothetical protein
MTDTEGRTRVRKPDTEEVAFSEPVTTKEELEVALDVTIPEAEVLPAVLYGGFRRDGFHIVDQAGRRILMCGVEGDIVRTGPGIAEAIVQILNKA